MLTDANPMPAVTAKTKVIAHTAQPASEVERWRACQSVAAHDGITSATRSAATPIARNSHPAVSLAPSERANQPFVVMPTPASASAAPARRIAAIHGRDGAMTPDVAGEGGGADGSATVKSSDENSAVENSAGINVSEDRNSTS